MCLLAGIIEENSNVLITCPEFVRDIQYEAPEAVII